MVDKRIVVEWVIKADEDFDFASSIIESSSYYSQICFHYHQSVEKYLKSFIIAHELEFQKIHDLIELFNICKTRELSLSQLQENCDFLNGFYIDTRYPVSWPTNYSKEVAIRAKENAENIGNTIKKLLRQDGYL